MTATVADDNDIRSVAETRTLTSTSDKRARARTPVRAIINAILVPDDSNECIEHLRDMRDDRLLYIAHGHFARTRHSSVTAATTAAAAATASLSPPALAFDAPPGDSAPPGLPSYVLQSVIKPF